MYFTKVEWTRRITTIGTIISIADNIVIDDYLNPVQDGYNKYDIILTRFGETVTYLLIIRRLGLQDAGTYTCTVFGRGFWSSKDGSVVVLGKYYIVMCITCACYLNGKDSFHNAYPRKNYMTDIINLVILPECTYPPGLLPYTDGASNMNMLYCFLSGVHL